jgi:type II secretory pathway pseudopilin PulG
MTSVSARNLLAGRRDSTALVRRGGFTLVEMLVVVGLVLLVLVLMFPAFRSMRQRSAQVREMGAARSLFTAWSQYADSNNAQILPGYKNGLPAYDEKGDVIATQTIGVAAARYPWRLAPYLSFNMRGLYLDANLHTLEELEATDYSNYLYQTSAYPSLGLNTTFVGGDENQGGFNSAFQAGFGKFYASRLSEIKHTDRVIVCASARGIDPIEGPDAPMREGYFRVKSPNFTAPQWTAYDPSDAASCGHVASRNGDRTVVGFVGGHVETKTVDELRDMRFWADLADDPDWILKPKS